MTSHFQVSKACASVVRAALTFAIMTISCMAASTSVAVPIGTYMYGLDDSGDIYEINPATQTTTKVFTSPPSTVLANSMAYDTSRGQVFFVDGASGLKDWQRGASSVTTVTGAPVSLSADPYIAAYYNAAIYFFEAITTTGAATAISGFVTTFGNGGFRDLGGSALNPVPEPSTIGLAAVGALAGLGWTLRRRLAAQCSWASSLKSPA